MRHLVFGRDFNLMTDSKHRLECDVNIRVAQECERQVQVCGGLMVYPIDLQLVN